MKVLIQDLETMRFLSADGRWIEDKDNARNFYSLLPAYNFARDHTSHHFQVLLYCPDDNFSASIIAGVGVANEKLKITSTRPKRNRNSICSKMTLHRFNGVFLPAGFDDLRQRLN